METQIKKRIYWLDIAKGIAIICTIIGHIAPFGRNVRNLIFSFHMPLFFILNYYLCVCVWLHWILVATHRLFSGWGKWKATPHRGEKPSHRGGFSCGVQTRVHGLR